MATRKKAIAGPTDYAIRHGDGEEPQTAIYWIGKGALFDLDPANARRFETAEAAAEAAGKVDAPTTVIQLPQLVAA